ncbi:BORC5-like protein [Mya arenaria]|uniref:BLOC-1-related complex subunit 5 n=1 Tax=Mya arenaria TaxID=6604 RepID=A0ABY7EIQ9_MYAAR|nr:BORC5-like protein [Mya arenaria]
MGAEQSRVPPAGAPGSTIRSQRDEDIPYTSLTISKPISADSPKSSPRNQGSRQRAATMPTQREMQARESTPKHNIVVVADGQTVIKDPDPELTRLDTIPVIYPILRGSLNLPTSARDNELLERMDPEHLLMLCLRYQEHLKQLSESETVTVLNRIKDTMNDIIPKMETLNKMLPADERMEPFQMKDSGRG